jgi:hypothetical protein
VDLTRCTEVDQATCIEHRRFVGAATWHLVLFRSLQQ